MVCVEPIIDKVAEYAGIQPPRVVYLTPSECQERGLDCPDIPTLDVNDPTLKNAKYWDEFCDRSPTWRDRPASL